MTDKYAELREGLRTLKEVGELRGPEAQLEALLAERDALRQALDGLLDIIDDSQGVSGYHLSGNVADWDEFDEVYAARFAGRGI